MRHDGEESLACERSEFNENRLRERQFDRKRDKLAPIASEVQGVVQACNPVLFVMSGKYQYNTPILLDKLPRQGYINLSNVINTIHNGRIL